MFWYLPSMSLFFSLDKMWFLVSYRPTFSDNVALFTVFSRNSNLTFSNVRPLVTNHYSLALYKELSKIQSSMKVNHECQPWMSTMKVNHESQPWKSFMTVHDNDNPCQQDCDCKLFLACFLKASLSVPNMTLYVISMVKILSNITPLWLFTSRITVTFILWKWNALFSCPTWY